MSVVFPRLTLFPSTRTCVVFPRLTLFPSTRTCVVFPRLTLFPSTRTCVVFPRLTLFPSTRTCVVFPRLTIFPSTRTCVGSCCLTDTGHLVDEVQKTSSRAARRTPNSVVEKFLANTGCYFVARHVMSDALRLSDLTVLLYCLLDCVRCLVSC